MLRAFSSGCTALTGVEAVSNGVPAFRRPKSQNAANTLAAMGIIAVILFVGVTTLAIVAKVHMFDFVFRRRRFCRGRAQDPSLVGSLLWAYARGGSGRVRCASPTMAAVRQPKPAHSPPAAWARLLCP